MKLKTKPETSDHLSHMSSEALLWEQCSHTSNAVCGGRGKVGQAVRNGSACLKAHLGALVMEAVEEALKQLVRIVNPLSILAHYPDHSSASLRLIQRVQILTQRGYHTLVPEKA